MNGNIIYFYNMEKKSKDYYIGILVGEYIVTNDLPTLSTDMMKTRRVIEEKQRI